MIDSVQPHISRMECESGYSTAFLRRRVSFVRNPSPHGSNIDLHDPGQLAFVSWPADDVDPQRLDFSSVAVAVAVPLRGGGFHRALSSSKML